METKKYEDEDLKITNIETWAKDALEKDQYYRTGGGQGNIKSIVNYFGIKNEQDAEAIIAQDYTEPKELEYRNELKQYLEQTKENDLKLRDDIKELVAQNGGQLPNSVDFGYVVGNVVELVINHSDYDLSFMEWGILQIISSRKDNPASFEEQSMLRITDRFAMRNNNRQYFGNQNGGKNTVAIPEQLSGLSNEDICRGLVELERKSKIQEQLRDLRLK